MFLLRLVIAVTVLAPTLWAQQNHRLRTDSETQTKTVSWQTPFSAPSPRLADAGLIIMLITDADPFLRSSGDRDELPPPWCQSVIATSSQGLFEGRPDLRDRVVFQHLAAGLPANLTGGKGLGSPPRAMLVVLDKDDAVLAWMVGVPEGPQLISLVEDAEETLLMKQLFKSDQARIGKEILERSTERLDRRWAATLNEQWLVMSGRPELASDARQDDDWIRSRLTLAATVFRRAYVKDVALRFGLTEKLDRMRLGILEQHPESRRPWCEAMMPFVVCHDFESLWRPMVESVWNVPHVSGVDDPSDFLTWWQGLREDQSIVLALRPPLLESIKAWPPRTTDAVATKRGLGWNTLQELLVTEAYREVTAYELSYLMRDFVIEPIDISSPSRVRYLYFESKTNEPVLIREGDIPARHVAFVKRNQK